MSHVDNYVIASTVCTLDIEKVNACEHIQESQFGNGFKPINEHVGGPKCLEMDLFAAAFNYGDEPVILEAIHRAIGEENRYTIFASVFVHREHDDQHYTVYNWKPDGWERHDMAGVQ